MRPLPRAVTALAALAVAATLAASPAAARTIRIEPAQLPRGADVAIPHLEKKTVVDGPVRIRIRAQAVRLLGKSGTSYVVGTANRTGGAGRILRVAADGTATRLARADIYLAELSGDGLTVVTTRDPGAHGTVVTARSASTGAKIGSRRFKGYASVLDAESDQVLVGGPRQTWIWTTTGDSVRVANRLAGYAGDLSSDVLAGYSKDPYRGGCSVMVRISTGERLWTSCTERVEAFAPDASRMVTVDILSDGIGPPYVTVRDGSGRQLRAYEVGGWFAGFQFETTTTLLLETHGFRRTAMVRCTDAGCERASDLVPTVLP